MMKDKVYNIIVPGIDYNGPVTLLLDLGRRAAELNYKVNIFYIKENLDSKIVDFDADIKKFKLKDINKIHGVVHSICIKPDFINILIKLLNKKVVCITTLPSFLYEDVKYDYGKKIAWITWKAWKLLSGIFDSRVVLSETMKKYYEKVAPTSTFDVIYHSRRQPKTVFLNPDNLKIINEQLNNYENNLIFVAGLRPRKNILRLIQEIYHHPDTSLTIFGDGSQKQEVLNAIDNSSNQIKYLGHDPNAHAYLNLFDMLVLPSFAEGLPGVVLEAIDQNCLCLLSDIEVHEELCQMGVGLTFNHNTFSDFYEMLLKVKSSKRHKNINNIFSEIKDVYFDHNQNFAKYEDLFQKNR